MSNEESIAIPSDKKLSSFRNTEEVNDGIEASISEIIVMLSFWLAGVVCVKSCTLE